jgi:hypothetical protein
MAMAKVNDNCKNQWQWQTSMAIAKVNDNCKN